MQRVSQPKQTYKASTDRKRMATRHTTTRLAVVLIRIGKQKVFHCNQLEINILKHYWRFVSETCTSENQHTMSLFLEMSISERSGKAI